jgi:hypothetical protein
MAAIGRFQKGDEIIYAKVVDGELYRLHGDVFGSPSFDKKPMPFKGLKTLTPVAPSKIIAVGLNYSDHARETGKPLPKEPLIWFKATTSLLADGGKIEIPFPAHRTDYEAELAIVIGRRVRNVTPAAAARYIFGYTASEDISDRTIQNSESQWARAKSLHLHPSGTLRRNQNRPARPHDPAFPERPAPAKLEHQPVDLQLLSDRQLRFHQHDPPPGGRHSDRHTQRDRPHRVRRPPGSAHPGAHAFGQHRQITLASSLPALRPG